MIDGIAATPPMGWNSWDCYGASVTEAEVRANAEYMAKHMKLFGWEYIVVDIQWYEPGAITSAYRPFVPLEMDEYSRLVPAPNRFPSSSGGKGFKPLADFIHGLGLKFGIHIMRGIPRQAVHANTPILGTEISAREIAHPSSICLWNTDMYGVEALRPGAQRYYDSLFELYASWGVDYVKVDDILDSYREGEIELIRKAISHSGREMVLSLSCGPVGVERAEHLGRNASMWRISADFWDSWDDLEDQFERCRQWSGYGGAGHWPDTDMLPLGHIAIRSCEHGLGDRWTRFTKDEQMTLMTLWCIFRSPLMMGGELRDNDEWTLSLLTNPEVLRVLNHSRSGRQVMRSDNYIVWVANDEDGSKYIAIFNTRVVEVKIELQLDKIDLTNKYTMHDCWKRADVGTAKGYIHTVVPSHGVKLFKLIKV